MKKWMAPLLMALVFCLAIPAFADGPTADRSQVIGTVIIANGDSARVRAQANAQSEQIGLVNPGEQYDCVDTAANGWYEIVYPTGQTGFISSKLAVLRKGVLSDATFSYARGTVDITHGGDVRTRNGGDGEYAFMGSVHPGESYPCVGISNTGWYAILLDNGWIVYVYDDLVTLRADAYITPNPIPQSAILSGATIQGIVTVTNDKAVNVRAGGDADYPILTQIHPADVYLFTGNFEGSSWRGIVLPDGSIGYVAPGMVEITKK